MSFWSELKNGGAEGEQGHHLRSLFGATSGYAAGYGYVPAVVRTCLHHKRIQSDTA